MKTTIAISMLLGVASVLPADIAHAGAQSRERPTFADIDTNDDGKLSLEEFSAIGSRRATPEEMFKRLDADGDGHVSADEYQARQRSGGRRAR